MSDATSPSSHHRTFPCELALVAFVLMISLMLATGCGSSGSSGSGPKLSGNTSVTMLLSSTADDKLTQFNLELKSLTLTSQSGKIVNLISAAQEGEAIHLNSGIEPIATPTIPQDVYTSAAATVGGASFTCITIVPPGEVNSGGLDISTYAYGYTPDTQVTVNLSAPLTITGDSMAVSLDLQVSKS